MSAALLDGKAMAAAIRARLKAEAGRLAAPPGLACVWSGEDASAASYRKGLAKACGEAGVRLLECPVPGTGLLAEIARLNADPAVAALLVQTPFPAGVDEAAVHAAIHPAKDAEGVTPASLGRLLKGEASAAPCTARAAFELAKAGGVPLKGAEAVVIGRSAIVGKPAALLLADAGATVTLCRSTTRDLGFHTRRAEILVVAAGRPGLVGGSMIRPGAVVVDVGINLVDGRVVGDVDAAGAAAAAGWLTPVPGGVGPVTVAMLLERTVAAAVASLARP